MPCRRPLSTDWLIFRYSTKIYRIKHIRMNPKFSLFCSNLQVIHQYICTVEPDTFKKKLEIQMGRYELVLHMHPVAQRKKELNLYLIFRPCCQTWVIFKGNAFKIQRDIDIFSFSEFLLIISDQKWFLSRYIKMSDQAGSFDTHIVIDCDISGPS